MKTKFSFLIALVAFFISGFSVADPIEQTYNARIKVNVLKTNKAGLKVYDIGPKGYLANNNDFQPDEYFINKGAYKVQPEEVGKQIPIFTPEDVKKFGLHCEYLCADNEDNVVGRAYIPKTDAKLLAKTAKK